MQIGIQGQKQGISFPTPPFENANIDPFSNQNFALVKYQFWFSERSTRFPCDILQAHLNQVEIPKNNQFYRINNFPTFDKQPLFIYV